MACDNLLDAGTVVAGPDPSDGPVRTDTGQ